MSASGSENKQLARNRHSNKPHPAAPPTGQSGSRGAFPARVLSATRRRRISARTAFVSTPTRRVSSAFETDDASSFSNAPNASPYGAFGNASRDARDVLTSARIASAHASRGVFQSAESARAAALRSGAPASASRVTHRMSASAMRASSANRAPAGTGRVGPRACATDSKANKRRSNTTPNVAACAFFRDSERFSSESSESSESSSRTSSRRVSRSASASSRASSSFRGRLMRRHRLFRFGSALGLCARQQPLSAHASTSPQSHAPPVSERYTTVSWPS